MCERSNRGSNIKNQTPANTKLVKLLNKLCEECRKELLENTDKEPTKKEVNDLYATLKGLLTSHQIRQIRQRLALTQQAASRLCGGGPNAFSLYEKGELTPPRSTSNLLRLLVRNPKEIKYLSKFKDKLH